MAERQISMAQAIGEALYQAMEADSSVIILGEDIAGGAGLGPPHEGSMGGSFGVTKQLLPAFGSERVRDTPISEAGVTGIAAGAAVAGLRPIVDMMWASFAPLAFDQIVNQAAKMRYMFGGQVAVPLTVRMAMGAGLGAAGQHSDTYYSLFTHIPGLKVVVPSNPHDAKGLLLAAIREDDPVMFFEHMALYTSKGDVPEVPYEEPLGRARLIRNGGDVTIVAIAAMVRIASEAAERVEAEGVNVAVIDPRTLSPLDTETILTSVAKTGRLVVVDESPPRCSIASDIAAMVSENAFSDLKAPVVRVTCPHSPVPLSPPLEGAYIPSVEQVVDSIRNTLN